MGKSEVDSADCGRPSTAGIGSSTNLMSGDREEEEEVERRWMFLGVEMKDMR